MDLQKFLNLCRAYRNLGDAVARQLDDICEDDPIEEQNPNAMKLVEKFLRDAAKVGVENAEDLANQIKSKLAHY